MPSFLCKSWRHQMSFVELNQSVLSNHSHFKFIWFTTLFPNIIRHFAYFFSQVKTVMLSSSRKIVICFRIFQSTMWKQKKYQKNVGILTIFYFVPIGILEGDIHKYSKCNFSENVIVKMYLPWTCWVNLSAGSLHLHQKGKFVP